MTQQPPVDFSTLGPQPSPPRSVGANISKMVIEVMLFYIRGLFTENLSSEHCYVEHRGQMQPLYIVDANAESQLHLESYPRIVVRRGAIQSTHSGGLDLIAESDARTGMMKKVEMFQVPMEVRIIGKHDMVEEIGSRIFMSLRFLTEPLKYLTIYKIAPPSFSPVQPYRVDAKKDLYTASISTAFWKEGSMVIRASHYPTLRAFSFRSRQAFDATTQRVRVTVS